MKNEPRLAVALWGPIVCPDASLGLLAHSYLDRPVTDGAFAALAQFLAKKTFKRVYIMSQGSVDVERAAGRWLQNHGFADQTGLSLLDVFHNTNDSGVAACCSELGVTHYVDCRVGAMTEMRSVSYFYLLRPSFEESRSHTALYSTLISADWPRLARRLGDGLPVWRHHG